MRYRHPQFGQAIVVSLGLTAVLLGGLGGALGERAIAVGGPLMMGVAARLFFALTVEIDATHPPDVSLRDRADSEARPAGGDRRGEAGAERLD